MDTDDRKLGRLPETLDKKSTLLHAKEVLALCQKNVDSELDGKTAAYARFSSEALTDLAATGEAPFASIVPGALEYKSAKFEDSLDNPIRPIDLKRPTGSTKFMFMVEELAKLGFDVDEILTDAEMADLVIYLDDSANDCLPGEVTFENVNKFVTKAVMAGISRGRLNRLFNAAKNRTGVLIGLSEEFVKDAGKDVWPTNKGKGNNHPCRYAALEGGLPIKYITKIVSLDRKGGEIVESLKLQVEEENVKETVQKKTRSTKKRVKGLEI